MFKVFSRRKGESAFAQTADAAAPAATAEVRRVLVVCSARKDWVKAFADYDTAGRTTTIKPVHGGDDGAAAAAAGGAAAAAGAAGAGAGTDAGAEVRTLPMALRIEVAQTDWADMRLQVAVGTSRPHVFMRGRSEPFQPDIVLVRSMVRGVTADVDWRNVLYAFRLAGVPAVNTWESIVSCLERPWLHAALYDVRARVGRDAFPLIDMTYYPSPAMLAFPPPYPLVLKAGGADAGYGKARVHSDEELADVRSLLQLHKDYVTVEALVPMAERVCDIRVQRIGPHVRCFRRTSNNWKGNVGTSRVVETPTTPTFARWAALASELFGGLDILTVDAIERADGSFVILEVNDTASGFAAETEAEDMAHVCELVLERLLGEPGAEAGAGHASEEVAMS